MFIYRFSSSPSLTLAFPHWEGLLDHDDFQDHHISPVKKDLNHTKVEPRVVIFAIFCWRQPLNSVCSDSLSCAFAVCSGLRGIEIITSLGKTDPNRRCSQTKSDVPREKTEKTISLFLSNSPFPMVVAWLISPLDVSSGFEFELLM